MSCTDETYEQHNGKFEGSGEIGEKLYELSMDGCTKELGDVEGFGWYGYLENTGLSCVPHAVLIADSQGFITYAGYNRKRELDEDWQRLEREYEQWEEEPQ